MVWTPIAVAAPDHARVFFPGVLAAVALLVVLAGPLPGLLVAAGVIVVDARTVATGDGTLAQALADAGFLALFAGAFGLVLRAEVVRLRARHAAEIERTVARWLDEARDFRLIGAVLPAQSRPPRSVEERQRLRPIGSLDALRTWTASLFALCRRAAAADVVRLFSSTPDGRIRELRVDGRPTDPVAPTGAIAAVLKTDRAVYLSPRGDGPRLGYEPEQSVGALVAVPVKTGPVVTGVLVAERREAEPFDTGAEALLADAATALTHAIETERVFFDMDRTRDEQARMLEAVRLIAEALGPVRVAERLVEAATRLSGSDVVAVSTWDPERRVHRIIAAHGEHPTESDVDSSSRPSGRLLGHELPDDHANLVSMALRERTPMPWVPLSEQPSRKHEDRRLGGAHVELRSVKVFPIFHRDQPLGALIVGSMTDPRRLSRAVESTLEAVVAQAAVSLANAQMYEHMERMATRDGLTGLVNHRRFQELLAAAIARAQRHEHPVSVVFVDADHFKTINDTFGHPVGDEVLRRIATALSDEARRSDVVARYGGEEFVLLLEGTDAGGAAELAERARRRIEALEIDGDFGRLRVTVSLGVCAYPALADDREALLARADRALYEAKRRGRNRVRLYAGSVCAETKTSDKGRDGDGPPGGHPRVPV
jgi:diguanylate cyclase (GGDEF)-like protein